MEGAIVIQPKQSFNIICVIAFGNIVKRGSNLNVCLMCDAEYMHPRHRKIFRF